MPDAGPQRERSSEAARKADHAGIARLADELLPALIAKLGTTHLGELEVREGDWHVRLRRPFGSGAGEGRRATDKPSRAQPGHEGHGHGRAAPEGYRAGRSGGAGAPAPTAAGGAASASTNGSSADAADRSRSIATSPAVGIFQPGQRATSGTRVRAGDVLGAVNVLGVPQELIAPADGIVGATLVEAGTAVEYGQELIRIELAATTEAR